MRVIVDTPRCIGAGQCVLSAPEIFDQDGNGNVVVLISEPAASEQDLVREAAYLCPSSTITITTDD